MYDIVTMIMFIAIKSIRSLFKAIVPMPSIALLLSRMRTSKRGIITGMLKTDINVALLFAFAAIAEMRVNVLEKAIEPTNNVRMKYV